jgi:hypothetical protein
MQLVDHMVTYAALPQNAGPLFALGAVPDHELNLLVCQVILQKVTHRHVTLFSTGVSHVQPLSLYREKYRGKRRNTGGEGALRTETADTPA